MPLSSVSKILMWTVFGILLVSVGGCSDDEEINSECEGFLFPTPGPPDPIHQFEWTYSNMMLFEFADLLHEDFKSILLPSTVSEWAKAGKPLEHPYVDRATEISIHENMFAGNAGESSNGEVVPPLHRIQVEFLDRLGSWEAVPDTDPYFGNLDGYSSIVSTLIFFVDTNQDTITVAQEMEFIVAAVDECGNTKWKILGQRFRGSSVDGEKENQEISLGALKLNFR